MSELTPWSHTGSLSSIPSIVPANEISVLYTIDHQSDNNSKDYFLGRAGNDFIINAGS
jgi:hypothetical protein